jgi:hypothetical protein
MSQNLQTSNARSSEKPFLIELWEADKQPGGYFTPAAAMHLTPALRTSGLLNQLSPDDLKSLVFLLTFVSPEGHCQPFLSQLAEAMRVSPARAKSRMRRLCDVRWKGESLVIYSKSASGLSAYSLNPRVVSYQHRKETERQAAAPYVAAPREAIIEHSRKHYARPRAEVERIIARQMGHDVDETDEERKIRYRLENAGLTGEQAREIVASYDLDSIAQQLDWLPFRHAKNPAGYLIAAIEGHYSEPRAVREERIFRELRYGKMQSGEQQSGEMQSNEQQPQELEDKSLQHTVTSVSDNTPEDQAASDQEIALLEADGEAIDLTPGE